MLNKPRLLAPGPTPMPERVRMALAQDMIHHRKPAFKAIMAEAQKGLRILFGTSQPVLPLACSGTGAMTAAVTNLFAPGEKVLVVEGGKFGERWGEISRQHGLEVVPVVVEWGRAVTAVDILAVLDAHPDISGVLIQLSETSTGVLHPVQDIAAAMRERNALLVVDGISSVGISPCPMDDWGVDCLLTGSQKGLMLPPGLALVALSEKAWNKAETVTPACFYFNLVGEKAKVEQDQTLFTTPVNLIMGLNECLAMMRETGFDTIFRKQWAMTMMVRKAIDVMGLDLLVKEHFTWGVTSILLPAGIDGQRLLSIAAEKYGVVLAGGQGHLKGRLVRIGHMGWVDWADLAAGLYAFAEAYSTCGGHISTRDYIEQGLQEYQRAFNER